MEKKIHTIQLFWRNRLLAISVSLLVAMILTVMPLVETFSLARPAFMLLVVVYWRLAEPKLFNIGTLWVLGLLTDILSGSLIGQHALAFTLTGYFILNLEQRFPSYPLWKQSALICVLIFICQLCKISVQLLINNPVDFLYLVLPPLSSMLLWLVMQVLLGYPHARSR